MKRYERKFTPAQNFVFPAIIFGFVILLLFVVFEIIMTFNPIPSYIYTILWLGATITMFINCEVKEIYNRIKFLEDALVNRKEVKKK